MRLEIPADAQEFLSNCQVTLQGERFPAKLAPKVGEASGLTYDVVARAKGHRLFAGGPAATFNVLTRRYAKVLALRILAVIDLDSRCSRRESPRPLP